MFFIGGLRCGGTWLCVRWGRELWGCSVGDVRTPGLSLARSLACRRVDEFLTMGEHTEGEHGRSRPEDSVASC